VHWLLIVVVTMVGGSLEFQCCINLIMPYQVDAALASGVIFRGCNAESATACQP